MFFHVTCVHAHNITYTSNDIQYTALYKEVSHFSDFVVFCGSPPTQNTVTTNTQDMQVLWEDNWPSTCRYCYEGELVITDHCICCCQGHGWPATIQTRWSWLRRSDCLQSLARTPGLNTLQWNMTSELLNLHVSKRGRKAWQTSQLHPGQLFLFKEREELPWVGFEPTALATRPSAV